MKTQAAPKPPKAEASKGPASTSPAHGTRVAGGRRPIDPKSGHWVTIAEGGRPVHVFIKGPRPRGGGKGRGHAAPGRNTAERRDKAGTLRAARTAALHEMGQPNRFGSDKAHVRLGEKADARVPFATGGHERHADHQRAIYRRAAKYAQNRDLASMGLSKGRRRQDAVKTVGRRHDDAVAARNARPRGATSPTPGGRDARKAAFAPSKVATSITPAERAHIDRSARLDRAKGLATDLKRKAAGYKSAADRAVMKMPLHEYQSGKHSEGSWAKATALGAKAKAAGQKAARLERFTDNRNGNLRVRATPSAGTGKPANGKAVDAIGQRHDGLATSKHTRDLKAEPATGRHQYEIKSRSHAVADKLQSERSAKARELVSRRKPASSPKPATAAAKPPHGKPSPKAPPASHRASEAHSAVESATAKFSTEKSHHTQATMAAHVESHMKDLSREDAIAVAKKFQPNSKPASKPAAIREVKEYMGRRLSNHLRNQF